MNEEQPWLGEPDSEEGTAFGFHWELKRTPGIGIWCGYVDVPYGHPWYGKDYDELLDVHVHGGVTYTQNHDLDWRVGFDCGHFGDVMPVAGAPAFALPGGTYKDIAYVTREVVVLCRQAREAANDIEHIARDQEEK